MNIMKVMQNKVHAQGHRNPTKPSVFPAKRSGAGAQQSWGRRLAKAACENAGRPAAISAPCQHPLTAAALRSCRASA